MYWGFLNMLKNKHITPNSYEFKHQASNGNNYIIMVAEPTNKPPTTGYGIIYTLDGDANFRTLTDLVALQTRQPYGYEGIIVVAIGYPSRALLDSKSRARDYTAKVPKHQLPTRHVETWQRAGEADAFLDYIAFELQPYLEQHYCINKERTALVGHSLGGFFALYALFTRPELFSHYIAGSPSVWWGNELILDLIQPFTPLSHKKLLLTIGGDELPDMLEGFHKIAQHPSLQTRSQLELQSVIFSAEDHISVIPSMLARIPKFLS